MDYDRNTLNKSTSDYLSQGLLTSFSELSSLNTYTIRNNEITISMNLALFSTILVLLLIFSVVFAVLLFLAISDKIAKRSNCNGRSSISSTTKIANNDLNLDSLKDLFSFFQSSSSSSKKVFSVDVQQEQMSASTETSSYTTTTSAAAATSTTTTKNERYVSMNPSRLLHLNLADIANSASVSETVPVNPSKFLDYDQTEYFSLKKKKQQALMHLTNDLIKLESTTLSSLNSSPKSTGTSSSSVSMTKSTLVNNDDSIVKACSSITPSMASRNMCVLENEINKYYL